MCEQINHRLQVCFLALVPAGQTNPGKRSIQELLPINLAAVPG
jgi:hypothetical protein